MSDGGRATPIGEQHRLSSHGYTAEIAGVGATLRSLRVADRDLVIPFDADEVRPAMRGAFLAPWPNRTADGRYAFQGVPHQLVRNEYETANAIHGLAAWLEFRCVAESADRVALTAAIEPQPGYPWRVRLDVVFALGAEGLTQTVTATNESADAAPFGLGGHPYLLAGASSTNAIDEWTLDLPADDVLLVSADRQLPTGIARVDAHDDGRLDFRIPRNVGRTTINNAFTSLRRDAEGWARVRLTERDGSGVEICWDERCPWVQLYTGDDPGSAEHRSGLAAEPMTCAPDAFNSGRDLRILEPGASMSAEWRIRAIHVSLPAAQPTTVTE